MATYTDNAKTPAPNAEVGFKLSKPGYDATRTAGQNYVFNSSWPSLPIAFETDVVGNGSVLPVPHTLGFPPFAMAWDYGTDDSSLANSSRRIIPKSNDTAVYLDTIGGRPYKVRCFQLDLTIDVDYTLAPGDEFNLPYDPNFGIKVVKQFKNIDSQDMRDFVLHSRCQSPLVLAVKTERTIPAANIGIGGSNFIQYTTDLDYPVWVYGFIKMGSNFAAAQGVPVDTYIAAPYFSQAYPQTFTDGFESYLGYLTSGPNIDNGATLVVLRDPMFAASEVTVQY